MTRILLSLVAALSSSCPFLPRIGDPLPTAPAACAPLSIERDVDVGGFTSDRYAWRDASCAQRTAALVHDDRADPAGRHGGYLRETTYEVDGAVRTVTGSSSQHPGWGYLTNHFGGNGTQAWLSTWGTGTFRSVLAGRHHAIHEYAWDLPLDGHTVHATVHWLFATGRDHPIWSVTFDASALPDGAVVADTRSPYGDLQWDGGLDADVDGVSWGDRFVFTTTSSPVTSSSSWSYEAPNTVPFVRMWSDAANAEMGAVQTTTFDEHPAGGFWLYDAWGTRSNGPMPQDWNWTFQLNQYELPSTTKSKRLAWGSNFGAVGKSDTPAYGDDRVASGWPYQSYAVAMVLGTKGAVPAAVADVEALQRTTIACTTGFAATSGPGGVARTDEVAFGVPGLDPVYGDVALIAEGGALDCTLTFDGATAPLLRVRGAGSITSVDGQMLRDDVDAYISVDDEGLWVTLPGARRGPVRIVAAP